LRDFLVERGSIKAVGFGARGKAFPLLVYPFINDIFDMRYIHGF
jgi:hypothetical protein